MKKFLLSMAILVAGAFALSAQVTETLTVGEGSNTSSTVPLNMLYWDSQGTTTQVIYNASMLEDMQGGTITAIKFYVSGTFTEVPDAVCQLSMGTTDQSEYTSATAITGLTVVKPEAVSAESGVTEVEYVFDTPFVYEGGNLVFECVVTTSAGWKSNNFLGANQDAKISMSRTTTYNFLPQTTFTYTPAEMEDYAANVNVNELNYGKTTIDTEKVLNVKLKNKGLNAFTPAISGLEAPFSTTYTPAELASGESVEIPVTFAPTEFNEYTGTMTIDCGEAGTFTVALNGICPNEFELTVCDGENQSQYAPIYGYYCDTQGTFVQMLYPADMLTELEGAKITEVKFYPSAAMTLGTPTIELSLKGTEETAFETESAIAVPTNLITELTTVASTTLASGDTELGFVLDQPYTYEGGNLAVQTLVAVKGSWQRTYFYGVNQETNTAYAQWAETGGYNQMIQFLPKMTIVYTKDETPVETITVAGTVVDHENNPIEGVNVTLAVNESRTSYTATTDAEGAYSMDVTPVEGATYDMAFVKDGYVTMTLEDVDLENVPEVVVLEDDNNTAISVINGNAVSVKYIDAMGRVSDRPFKGVNIVVTTNADGTTSTTKVVK
mgnify:CR=1 FL=1